MKLILTQDVAGLGAPGDVVEVKDGYGRNYLVPRGFAIQWTRGGEKQVTQIKRAQKVREVRDLGHANEIKQAIEGLTVTVTAHAGDSGRLFGSVTNADIADAVVAAAAGAPEPPLLVVCPDQNGPSIERALRARGATAAVEIVTYPALGDPRFVDWVDYADRNAAADPVAIAGRALELAGGRTVLYAYTGNYRTLEGQCEAVLQALATVRGAPSVLVPPSERNEDEPAIELLRFEPR